MSLEINKKTNFVIGIALAALAVLGCLSVIESRNLSEADRWVSHTHDVLEAGASLRSHQTDAAIARRFFLQGDKTQSDAFEVAANASLADLHKMRNLTADNRQQQQRVDDLEPLVRARIAMLEKSFSIHQENTNDEAAQQKLTEQLAGSAAQLAEQARSFESVERRLLADRSAKAEKSLRQITRIHTALSTIIFCFILVAAYMLNREWSRRIRTEQAIAEQKLLLQSILDTCNDAIVVSDNSHRIILRNPACIRLCGDALDRLTEDVPARLGYYQADGMTLFSHQDLPLWHAVHGNGVDNLEMCVRPSAREQAHWVLASSRPLLNQDGQVRGGVAFYRDITDRKELENKLTKYADDLKQTNVQLEKAQVSLERLAWIDELTGLHNRRGFLIAAEQSAKLAQRTQKTFSLVFVDLDGLKKINDTFGHAEGDRAIADAALVLRDSFRHCDVLGRLGGDEFAILMVDVNEESATIVRKRLRDKLDKLNASANRTYRVSLSVGMLWCDADQPLPIEVLLSKADALMYEDKRKRNAARGSEIPNILCGTSPAETGSSVRLPSSVNA